MGVSAIGASGGGPAGQSLLAWAKVNQASGAVIAGNNISGIAHTATTGVYAITFTAAVANANYLGRLVVTESDGTRQCQYNVASKTTAGCTLNTFMIGASNQDPPGTFVIEIYG